MRAFIAVDFSEEIRAHLTEEQRLLRSACERQPHAGEIRWTRPEGIHLTLKFLGQVPDDKLRPLTAALGQLGGFEPFWVEVKGFGFFPNARRPRVFWVGIEAPPALQTLATRVENAMERLGYPPEQRTFTPHLTLARFQAPRPQTALEALIQERQGKTLGRFEVSEYFLFESRLSPRGAEYRKIARFPAS